MTPQPTWIVPEEVQTSAMDCGPAALAALLLGHGIQASYGRLREACQTSVDGTSIDTIEEVALALGLHAEQMMLPVDFLAREQAEALPALAVVTLPSGSTHFIVIWRRLGAWVQLMDPAVGRRWQRWDDVVRELYIHQMAVPAAAWYEWALSEEAQLVWSAVLDDLGLDAVLAAELLQQAAGLAEWRGLATLDAATRLATALVRAQGLERGPEAYGFILACLEELKAGKLPLGLIPYHYWFALPMPPAGGMGEDAPPAGGMGEDAPPAPNEAQVLIRGAVVLRVRGRLESAADAPPLPPDLAAAINEPPPQPGRMLFQLVGRDGWLPPSMLLLALLAAAAGVTAEALLLQGVMQVGSPLFQGEQRGGALLALFIFLVSLTVVDLMSAIMARLVGNRLEARLRIALLEKIPRLGSSYFHSRLVSDMAGRAHSLRMLRTLPVLVANMIQLSAQVILTTIGLIWLNPSGAVWAIMLTLLFALILVTMTPANNEVAHRVQNHSGALSQVYLDALLGLAPLRLHGAERSLQREHEQLMATWWRANGAAVRINALTLTLTSFVYVLFAVTQVFIFLQTGGNSERVLLLLYWTLSLPGLAQTMINTFQQYPAMRARVMTLLEPLNAPDEDAVAHQGSVTSAAPPSAAPHRGVAISFERVSVQAGGHTILDQLDLSIAPGEHVAVVGPSGAGKSSLAGVLLGWHSPAAGRCLIDGQPLDGASIQALRRTTAWVDPAVQIWNRSLMANLSYGRPEGGLDPLVIEQAELLGVLERLPSGMQTHLGENGGLVSGGEGQRVRLGRALGHPEPRLVVLDEPFRGLDRSQRAGLLARVRRLWAEATMLCITHDVAETLSFNRVIVVEAGRIVEDGNPADLAANPETRYHALLAAEERVQREGWANPAWRHVRIVGGELSES